MKGSLTVEAAFIFPFCFLVISIVCILGIYKYNEAVLKMTAYECILETLQAEEEHNFEKILEEKACEAASVRTLAIQNIEVTAKSTITKISLTYKCVQQLLNLPLEITVVYERTFPELTLRLLEKGLRYNE